MTILVDEARWPWRGQWWAHLCSDTSLAELHRFADRLGVRRVAFQGDHYDVNAGRRADAIAAGAVAVGSREVVRRLRAAGLLLRAARRAYRWTLLAELSELPELPELPELSEGPDGGDARDGPHAPLGSRLAAVAATRAAPAEVARVRLGTETALAWFAPVPVSARVLARPGELAAVLFAGRLAAAEERHALSARLVPLMADARVTVEAGATVIELLVAAG